MSQSSPDQSDLLRLPPPVLPLHRKPDKSSDEHKRMLRRIASEQRRLLICTVITVPLLCIFITPYLYFLSVGPVKMPEVVPIIWLVIALSIACLGFMGVMFFANLAVEVYGMGFGIFMLVLSLVTPLGPILLIVLIVKARIILKDNSIKVGLFSADLDKI